MIYTELLSPVQLKKLLGGNAMGSFITVGSRTTCKKCGHDKFARTEDDEDKINIPICEKCRIGKPKLYRVGFSLPIANGKGFSKYLKSKNEVGEKLDTLTKAKNFMAYIENKVKREGVNFDPREIGSEKERQLFIVKHFSKEYLKHLEKRVEENDLSPSGFSKIEGMLRLYIVPNFGDLHLKQVTYSYTQKVIAEKGLLRSIPTEMVKVMKPFLKHAEKCGLIKSVPTLPSPKRENIKKASDFYTSKERDLVISRIKKRRHQIAITILYKYVARQSELRCLRWSDIDFSRETITFARHLSDGKGKSPIKELSGLKSSPDRVLIYPFFPGLKALLFELVPSFNKSELVFKGRSGYQGKGVLWAAWTKAVKELKAEGLIDKEVDLHRGTRSSTLSALLDKGFSYDELNELYGGNVRTMEKYYAKKEMQKVSQLWEVE
jgi:integrase